jgi:hypothetical protein
MCARRPPRRQPQRNPQPRLCRHRRLGQRRDSEDDFKGLFDDLDVNSSKLGPTVAKRNEKLVKLLDAIGDLPLQAGGSFSPTTPSTCSATPTNT